MRPRRLSGAFLLLFCLGCGAEAGKDEPMRTGEAGSRPRSAGAPAPSEGKLRLAQVFVLPGSMPWEIQDSLAAARRAGADVVALRAFHLEGDRPHGVLEGSDPPSGTYFPSEHAVAPDFLAVAVEAAHAEGLHLWAWMTTLDCRWFLEEDPDLAGAFLDPMTGDITPTRKLDPFDPGAVERLRSLFHRLGTTGVDGILFQDDLVLRHLEGWTDEAVRAWETERGQGPDPAEFYERVRREPSGRIRVGHYTAAYREWSRWRGRRLLDLAETVADAADRGAGRRLTRAFNVYYDELWNPEGGLLWLARDLEAARRRGFHRYVVMAYHRQIGMELDRRGEPLAEALALMAERLAGSGIPPAQAVVKLQTVDWGTKEPLTAAELRWAWEPWRVAGGFSLGLAPWQPGFPTFDEIAAEERVGGEPPDRGDP